jgi:hypothetical protein
MRKRLTWVVALVGLAIVSWAPSARAATITATYVNIQTSDNLHFNAIGNVANFGSNVNALGFLPVGKFFRFGIAINVSNNANPAAALWANTPTPQPANLGVAHIAFTVQSTDSQGNNVAAVQGIPVSGGRNASTAVILGIGTTWTFATDPGDVLGDSSQGTRNALGSGQVGQLFQIFSGNTQATANNVGVLATPGATWFDSLTFQVVGSGFYFLTPTIFTAGTNIWHLADPGNPGDPADPLDDIPPSYSSEPFSATGPSPDVAINPTPIVPIIPEPASMGFISFGLLAFLVARQTPKRRSSRRQELG